MVIPIVSILLISIISFSFSDKIKTRVITSTINQLGLNSESESWYYLVKLMKDIIKLPVICF